MDHRSLCCAVTAEVNDVDCGFAPLPDDGGIADRHVYDQRECGTRYSPTFEYLITISPLAQHLDFSSLPAAACALPLKRPITQEAARIAHEFATSTGTLWRPIDVVVRPTASKACVCTCDFQGNLVVHRNVDRVDIRAAIALELLETLRRRRVLQKVIKLGVHAIFHRRDQLLVVALERFQDRDRLDHGSTRTNDCHRLQPAKMLPKRLGVGERSGFGRHVGVTLTDELAQLLDVPVRNAYVAADKTQHQPSYEVRRAHTGKDCGDRLFKSFELEQHACQEIGDFIVRVERFVWRARHLRLDRRAQLG